MYDLKFDFKQYNETIAQYMKILIENSINNFQQQIRTRQVINSTHDADVLAWIYKKWNFKGFENWYK